MDLILGIRTTSKGEKKNYAEIVDSKERMIHKRMGKMKKKKESQWTHLKKVEILK